MRLAHYIQRYPPALGGSEAYFARLSRYCVEQGDAVTVFTTNAQGLDAFWSPRGTLVDAGTAVEDGVTVRRYPLWQMHGRRWLLKPLSLIPHRLWQCLTMPCNPISLAMWNDSEPEAQARNTVESLACASGSDRNAASETLFDAVHASAFPYAFPIVCARRLARRLGVPFFITPFLHLGNPDDSKDRTRQSYTAPPLRWLLNEADGVFVQTPSERDAARFLGLPDKKIILQGLGVEPNECTGGNRVDARQRWGLPNEAFVVGHLANNSWEKGTNDLLAAMELLWHRGLPVYLLLAGPEMPNFGRCWTEFERRWPTPPSPPLQGGAKGGWVRRLGPISDADKRGFFASIDVFALPSRSDSFGLVLLEAWANGVPNIGYRAGGIADVIRDDSDGLLVPCGSIDGLTAAILRLYEDIRIRERLGQAGLARLPNDFRWQDKLDLVRRTISQSLKR